MSSDIEGPPLPTYRIEFYQNESDVVASVFIKQLRRDEVTVTFQPDTVRKFVFVVLFG